MARMFGVPTPVPKLALTIYTRRYPVQIANHYELAAAFEVLCTADYDVPLPPESVRRVLDLGANVGFAGTFLLQRATQTRRWSPSSQLLTRLHGLNATWDTFPTFAW